MLPRSAITVRASTTGRDPFDSMNFFKIFGFVLLALGWTPISSAQYENCTGELSWIGDGYCDETLNYPECQYDGGDCCDCTCVDSPNYACGANGFACKDPACLDFTLLVEFPNCAGNYLLINDGGCNAENNNPECGYDGGDCCLCTCVANSDCFFSNFDCVDPSAEEELYDCQPSPSSPDACGVDIQTSWVVETSTQARAMAEAVNCSGGTFNVEWRGVVAVDKTINVVDGTFLNITGVGNSSTAMMDGGLQVRLIMVINASLYLSDLGLSAGSSVVGGAIAASASNVTAIRTSFIGNRANGTGGAIYATWNSVIFFNGNATTFVNNSANAYGGAIYGSSSSIVRFNGIETIAQGNAAGRKGGTIAIDHSQLWLADKAFFTNSTSGNLGGAIDVTNGSIASSTGSLFFLNNTASIGGGALSASMNSNVSWKGETSFESNAAVILGGAIYVDRANISWSGNTKFTSNIATSWSGGAIAVLELSKLSWSGDTIFEYNRATFAGGAIYVRGAKVSWSGVSSFVSNWSERGGALYILLGSLVWWSGPSTVFAFNTATSWAGGAISIFESRLSCSGDVTFESNRANASGGAIYANRSEVSWEETGVTVFQYNEAFRQGGAFFVDGTVVSWLGNARFTSNTATSSSGGAIESFWSSISWDGDTLFEHNWANDSGGAVHAIGAEISWSGVSSFSNNSAGNGGAVFISSYSSMRWSGPNTTFSFNTAMVGFGGAVLIRNSNLSWTEDTTFEHNRANTSGGAIYANRSKVSWDSNTAFVSNTAIMAAGAVEAAFGTKLSWNGTTSFLNNSAMIGGSMHIHSSSDVKLIGPNSTFISNVATKASGGAIAIMNANLSWSGVTVFFNNSAESHFGGGITIWSGSRISCSGNTIFARNKAFYGGAVYISRNVLVEWYGMAVFDTNEAEIEGGAIGSAILDASADREQISYLYIAGTMRYVNNFSRRNGGAISLTGGLSLEVGPTANVTFQRNKASAAGGAVFISGADIGPKFLRVSFISNSAQLGGAVYATSSGNAKIDLNGQETLNPTIYESCSFVDNVAVATGGAIQSAAGQDYIIHTSFTKNSAGVGGALFLGGTSNFMNCSFIDNVSDEGGGPVVSNIGYVESMQNSSFAGNDYGCSLGTFRAYDTADKLYAVLCIDCAITCEQCHFDDPFRVPYCEEAMAHSTSQGGSTTIEQIAIDPGYWRAKASSKVILPCYNPDACEGGVTGSSNYCRKGYKGPYCSICSDGYTEGIGFTCDKCFNRSGGIVLAVVMFGAAVFAITLLARYLVSEEFDHSRMGFLKSLLRYIPLQSVKIAIVSWQILTQFASVANVTYPNTYQRFLDAVNVLNFDLSWVLSVGCVFKLDFHDRLLFATLGPIICVAMLGVTYGMAAIRNHGASEALANVQQKHLSATLLLTFFIYSSVSSILFQTFACEKLDDGNIYLRADYRIQCDSPKHEAFTVYAGFMTVLYAFGIPALYTSLLLKDRHVLVNCDGGNNIGSKDARSNNPRVRSTSNLWKPYKPKRFYYEVVECGRRILLTGVVVFIFPDSAAQIAVTLIIALTFAMASEVLDPYASTWDTWMGRMGHVVVFLSVYVALLLKVDVSAERAESQKVFEAILVFVHACMIVAVLVEALVMACSLREEGQEDPFPRFRRMKWIHRTRGRSSAKTGFVTESKTAEVELPVADANVEVERKVVTQSDMEGRGNETKVT